MAARKRVSDAGHRSNRRGTLERHSGTNAGRSGNDDDDDDTDYISRDIGASRGENCSPRRFVTAQLCNPPPSPRQPSPSFFSHFRGSPAWKVASHARGTFPRGHSSPFRVETPTTSVKSTGQPIHSAAARMAQELARASDYRVSWLLVKVHRSRDPRRAL